MKKLKNIRCSAVAAAIFSLGVLGAARAELGNITVWADDDNSRGERLLLQAGGNAWASGNNNISGGAAFVQIDSSDFIIVQTDGILYLNSSEARINNNAIVAGTATIGNGAVVTGNTTINSTGGADTIIGTLGGSSVNRLQGASNILNGTANTVIGATSINTTGGADTIIGTLNGASVNVLQGASNTLSASGANSITGATNSLLATTGNNSITSTAGANAISAQTGNSITTATGNNAMTASVGSNNLTAATANNIQAPLNNIGTDRVAVNNMGTGAFQSTNNIGNTQSTTTVNATAGNASQSLANGSANTKVTQGTSGLTARVATANSATTGQVLLSNTAGTTVDVNGKILVNGATGYVNPAAPTAAVTLTNGYGNTHGLVVTESQATLSGGTQSSSMTLNDRAATFSNAQTGAPITVTGVADGRADFDAVNVRQFAGAIAAVAAQANIPALSAGQDRTFGMGVGNFMGKSALAMGMNVRGEGSTVYKFTLSSGLNEGGKKPVVAAGAAWGF